MCRPGDGYWKTEIVPSARGVCRKAASPLFVVRIGDRQPYPACTLLVRWKRWAAEDTPSWAPDIPPSHSDPYMVTWIRVCATMARESPPSPSAPGAPTTSRTFIWIGLRPSGCCTASLSAEGIPVQGSVCRTPPPACTAIAPRTWCRWGWAANPEGRCSRRAARSPSAAGRQAGLIGQVDASRHHGRQPDHGGFLRRAACRPASPFGPAVGFATVAIRSPALAPRFLRRICHGGNNPCSTFGHTLDMGIRSLRVNGCRTLTLYSLFRIDASWAGA